MTSLIVQIQDLKRESRCTECEKKLSNGSRTLTFAFDHKGLLLRIRACEACGLKHLVDLTKGLDKLISNLKGELK